MRHTCFHSFHVDHQAKLVEFAGWEMPISYGSIHQEHRQVREAAGLFDVSHMGRIEIAGRHARRLLERILTRRISDMVECSCRYSLICNDHGGTIDDVIVYRFENHWLLVVNAANRQTVLDHLQAQIRDLTVRITDQTNETAMVALQGPKVMDHIGKFSSEVPTLKRYHFCLKNLLVLKMTISRTGYTGEDGVEVILPVAMAPQVMELLLKDSGTDNSMALIKPTGLGARDTLRMEAGMPLFGHELSEQIDPLSAGLGFAVSFDKDEYDNGEPFVGQNVLKKIAAEGPKQRLVGLKIVGRRTARQGMKVIFAGKLIGHITSGCLSPTLGYPIAMAYVDAQFSEEGGQVSVDLGTKQIDATIATLPFYKRPSA